MGIANTCKVSEIVWQLTHVLRNTGCFKINELVKIHVEICTVYILQYIANGSKFKSLSLKGFEHRNLIVQLNSKYFHTKVSILIITFVSAGKTIKTSSQIPIRLPYFLFLKPMFWRDVMSRRKVKHRETECTTQTSTSTRRTWAKTNEMSEESLTICF